MGEKNRQIFEITKKLGKKLSPSNQSNFLNATKLKLESKYGQKIGNYFHQENTNIMIKYSLFLLFFSKVGKNLQLKKKNSVPYKSNFLFILSNFYFLFLKNEDKG